MCRSDALIGLSSTRTSASPGVKGGVGISAIFNTLFGSPVSRKINAFINTSRSLGGHSSRLDRALEAKAQQSRYAGVVQKVRTPVFHAGGRGFASRRSRHSFQNSEE